MDPSPADGRPHSVEATATTLADRARLLEALRSGKLRRSPAEIAAIDSSQPQPLSFGQRRMWFLNQVHGGSAYTVCLTVRVQGRLNIEALRQAVDVLIQRHGALRTAFREIDGEPMQVVLPPRPEDGSWDALMVMADVPEIQVDAAIRDWVADPFDLANGPLLRALLLQTDHYPIFALAAHHIAVDSWSMALLQRDLSVAYDSFTKGERPHLPEPAPRYVDFAVWQRQRLAGEAAQDLVDYWTNQLQDAPEQIDLPFDRPRPTKPEFKGGEIRFPIGQEVAARIRDLSLSSEATPFMIMLAGFASLLHRYSRQSDIVIGTPVAGRERTQLEQVVGFFANTLALRIDLSEDLTFRELLSRVRATALDGYANHNMPFEMLVEQLALRREFSHNPLFQVMFAFQNTPQEDVSFGDLGVEPLVVANDTAKFDLWLSVSEAAGDGYIAALEYDSTLFEYSTAERIARHLVVLLTAAVESPDVPISRLPMIAADEREHVLRLGTGRHAPDREEPVHGQFLRHVVQTPEAVAVSFDGNTLTYRQLDERANQVANRLRELGAAPGELVAVLLPRSIELVVALVAVLKAGAAYVPVDPDFPPERVAFMLSDADAQIVVTRADHQEKLGGESTPTVLLLEPDVPLDAPTTPPEVVDDPDDLAYVIYTSGSTGKPKGAMIHHRGLANRLAWMTAAYKVGPADRILQKTPYSFDVSVWEFFLPLINGATLVVARPGVHRDPFHLAKLMADESVTIAHFVPAMLGVFLDQAERPALPQLRLLVCSGEALPVQLAQRAAAELGVRCENLYGPTEASIDVTAYSPGSSSYEARCAVTPIGLPIDNIFAVVLGTDMEIQPIGVPGELFLGGQGVGRGYLRRPGLTAERFVPDPFHEDGGYLYRTGDLARLLPDGNIEFLGRLDEQIKIHGLRVELGEIEATLLEHPGVQSAVVAAAPAASSLVAYVVPVAVERSPNSDMSVVGQWRGVFDETFKEAEASSGPDYAGWRSSFTGEEYSAAEMAEWVDNTAAEILALHPRSILEIGCGTGLVIEKLLPHTERYTATDASAEAVRVVTERHRGNPAIQVHRRLADDIDDLGDFDVGVLNSVIQYFPDVDYLGRVLTTAIDRSRGALFIGDVRDLRLLNEFHLHAQLARTPGIHADDELRKRVEAAAATERELVVDPRYFVAFAQRHGLVADIRLKVGAHATEMNIFRYDVRLRRPADDLLLLPKLRTVPWQGCDIGDLMSQVSGGEPIVITSISHPVQAPIVERLRALIAGEGVPAAIDPGPSPAELVRMATERNVACYCVPVMDRPGTYQAVLAPPGFSGVVTECGTPGGEQPMANDPGARLRERELATELRERCACRLPDYMVPTDIVTMPALPLTPSGKVDRRALTPRPLLSQTAYERPAGAVESQLAGIITNLLGVPDVGRHDDFFSIGGESIVALQLVNKARDAGISLTPRTVFQYPTVAGMAEHCADDGAVSEKVPTETAWRALDTRPWALSGEIIDSYPLSPIQYEMLSVALDDPKPGLYTAILPLSIDSADFDENAFASAWQYVMQRHPILRTSFHWRGLPHPVQTVWRIDAPPLTGIDLTGLSEEDQQHRVAQALAAERRHIFDLEKAPLWHITLFRLGAGKFKALMRFNYMLQDGWSFQNMQRAFFYAYDQFRAGVTPQLPPVPGFDAYISWLMSRDDAGDAQYWTGVMKRFTGRTPLLEILGTPRQTSRWEISYGSEELSFSNRIVEGLSRLGRERGITSFTLLQGAWALLLAGYTDQHTTTFGVLSSGRPEQLTKMVDMVGPFNNMLPAVVTIDEDASTISWLRQLQADQAEMREHQYTSLAQIRHWAGLSWGEALYDSYLVFENFPMDLESGERLIGWAPESGTTQTEHPVRVLFWPLGGLSMMVNYYTKLFDAAAVRKLLDDYRAIVESLVDRPDVSVSEHIKAVSRKAGGNDRP